MANNMNDDLLPESPQARAILAALDVLKQAGIDAMFDIDTGSAPQYRLALKPSKETPAAKEELRRGIQAALEYQWQTAVTNIAVSQAKNPGPR